MIEQALFTAADGGGYTCRARSPGFGEEWLPGAERICAGFGNRPETIACPGALFAQPFESRFVAVAQVQGQGKDGFGPLAFRFLVLPKEFYADLHGDLFRVADAFAPDWNASGALPVLEWTAGPPPRRTVEMVKHVLDMPNNAFLLGGVQVLVDGGRLVLERSAPDESIVRSLWALLPISNRCEQWPATFAFSNTLGFDVVVVPRAEGPDFAHYVTELQAVDSPDGRYEYALEFAAKTEFQEGLDDLFCRKSGSQMRRLALVLLILFGSLSLLNAYFNPPPTPTSRQASPQGAKP